MLFNSTSDDVLLFFFLALSGPNVFFSLFAKLPPLVGGVTNDRPAAPDPEEESEPETSKFINFDDYYFVEAALRHPMRVPNPAQAKLFVVPTLNNRNRNLIINKEQPSIVQTNRYSLILKNMHKCTSRFFRVKDKLPALIYAPSSRCYDS